MKYIIFPGRHHSLTNFQHDYFSSIADHKIATTIDGNEVSFDEGVTLVWAVTSANHSNTRRNPLSSNRREAMIELFAENIGVTNVVYPITDIGQSADFASFMLKEISAESHGTYELTNENTVVACSTPSVIKLFEELGFAIIPVELVNREDGEAASPRPWEFIERIAELRDNWDDDEFVRSGLHSKCIEYYKKYKLDVLIQDIFTDPILGDEGDLTQTRNYATYRQAFEDGAIRKYTLLSDQIKPGRILDIGCATGEFLKLMGQDSQLKESDLFGVEIARPLYEICRQRKSNGEFDNENTFFYQRNILSGNVFKSQSLNTITSVSLTHEVESYAGREQLHSFIKTMHEMLAPDGVWINMDVVGPDNKDELVEVAFNTEDGELIGEPYKTFDMNSELKRYLDSLSSYSRFLRFARDFRSAENDHMSYEKTADNTFKLRRADLADYLAKKDYTENWYSEMHERFCYWEFADWKQAVQEVGFEVDSSSYAYTNEWLIENRFAPAVINIVDSNGNDVDMNSFQTNMLLVARKK